MIRKILFSLCLFFYSSFALAEQKIVILDIEKVLSSSLAAKHASETIKKRLDTYQLEINKKSDELKIEQEELISQTNILTQEVLQEKQASFIGKLKSLEKEVQVKKKELDGLYVKAIAEIEKSIDTIVKELSEKEDYNIVMAKSEVIHFRNVTDISSQVLGVLNKRLKKVNVEI